jgi:hypothetical protein
MNHYTPDDTGELSKDQRRGEVAAMLATAILRLHSRNALHAVANDEVNDWNSEEPGPACLDVSPKIVLIGHTS